MASKLVDEKDFDTAVSEFNENPHNFICRETLKIFVNTKDEAVALQGLELLRKATRE